MTEINDVRKSKELTTRNNIVAVFDDEFPINLLPKDVWPPDKCWYCEERAPDDSASRVTILAKKSRKKPDQYRLVKITTPRCKRCRQVHRKRVALTWAMAIAAFPLLIFYLYLLGPLVDNNLGIILIIVFWFVSFILLFIFLPKILMSKSKDIKDKISEIPIAGMFRTAGWSKYLD